MNTLRVLLVENDPTESRRICSELSDANYSVIPADGLDEATEALMIQRFDAVLLGSLPPTNNLAAFTTDLRERERQQQASSRTPVLSLGSQSVVSIKSDGIDAYLPQGFDPTVFAETVANLAQNVQKEPKRGAADDCSKYPIFELEELREQVAYDDDLLAELVDLFLSEYPDQVLEMRAALGAEDYELLSRVAHTIKGSLGSLHATRARFRSQELELAAKRLDIPTCHSSLAALESDLDALEPLLSSLRPSASSH